jgi:hypothetical protein
LALFVLWGIRDALAMIVGENESEKAWAPFGCRNSCDRVEECFSAKKQQKKTTITSMMYQRPLIICIEKSMLPRSLLHCEIWWHLINEGRI